MKKIFLFSLAIVFFMGASCDTEKILQNKDNIQIQPVVIEDIADDIKMKEDMKLKPIKKSPFLISKGEDCTLEPNNGPCKGIFPRYYFDEEKGCTEFGWGGCQGTVPFETMAQCKKSCGSVMSKIEELAIVEEKIEQESEKEPVVVEEPLAPEVAPVIPVVPVVVVPDPPETVPVAPACVDNDGDGYFGGGINCEPYDCDDTSKYVPKEFEVCLDGIDNDCNGQIDEENSCKTRRICLGDGCASTIIFE
jgi:hypothetical protein